MSASLSKRYLAAVAAGEIGADPAQKTVAMRLDRLGREVDAWRPRLSPLGRLMYGAGAARKPRGVYLHGGVGRGKTMLMDMLYDTVRVTPRRRLHFHAFMAEVHERISDARKKVAGDPIPVVGRQIAERSRLLCFDELHVTDIADAMILGRLFAVLMEAPLVLVATSNVHPTLLYKDGLNRPLFEPFVDLIQSHLDVVELAEGHDFRLQKLAGRPLYFSPADGRARSAIDALWSDLTGGSRGQPMAIEVKGRQLHVPAAAMGVARFTFDELCMRPLGPLDYLALAREFHTLILEGVPVMGPARRNEARRLINLVDTLYDNRVGLIVSAEAEPDALYQAGDGSDLFQRTASRLMEMRTTTFLAGRGERALHAAAADGGG